MNTDEQFSAVIFQSLVPPTASRLFRPFRQRHSEGIKPRAMPWAFLFWPYRTAARMERICTRPLGITFLIPPAAAADGKRCARREIFDEAAQVAAAGVMLQLVERLGFDLSDALARDLEDDPRFLEGIAVPVSQAKTELDDLAFAVGQGFENAVDLVFEDLVHCRFGRRAFLSIFK